jgi:multidrug efflux system membrane fusion protein
MQEVATLKETTHEDRVERPPRRRLLFPIIAGAIILIIVIIAVRAARRPAAQAQQGKGGKGGAAVPVSVAAVQQRDVPVFLDGLGNVTALNTVTVKTRIDGQLLRFNFQEGQVVHSGEELALIDPRPSQAALAQAQANRFKDAAQLENTRRDLTRYADLSKSGVIPQQQYDAQKSAVAVNEGTVLADDAQILNAKLNVSYCHIKAPITGRVGIRNVDPGNMVHASDANGLVVITQMQPIAALFTLPEDDLPAVVQHMRLGPLPVQAWSRDSTQEIGAGRLMTIDNQIDPNTGTFRCKATFDNSDGALYPNQFVDARLQVDIRRNALTVPSAAIQHGAQGTYLYVVLPDKTVDMRPVQVTLTEGTMAVLASGVNAGDQVVTEGADKLQPHGKVEIGGGQKRGGRGGPAPAPVPGSRGGQAPSPVPGQS